MQDYSNVFPQHMFSWRNKKSVDEKKFHQLFILTLDKPTKFVIMTICLTQNLHSLGDSKLEIMQEKCWNTSRKICFGYFTEAILTNIQKHMFCEETEITQGLSYIAFCLLNIFYSVQQIYFNGNIKCCCCN